jgi:hypothetical protein
MFERSEEAVIIGGRNNCLAVSVPVHTSIIVGSSGSIVNGGDCTVFVDCVDISQFILFTPYTNTTAVNGDFWLNQSTNKFMFRNNNTNYCIGCN